VIGLVNATGVRPGDTLSLSAHAPFPPLPAFPPAHFAIAAPLDRSRQKQFRAGIEHLDHEGVIQLLTSDRHGRHSPLLGAVGPMQFDVVRHRMSEEFRSPITLTGEREALARCTDREGARLLAQERDCDVVFRTDGTPLVIVPDRWRLRQLRSTHPDLVLETTSPTDHEGSFR
jgi:peptide chain release factor 3